MSSITTPCVGICSSGIGDDVCRGCKRFANEVIEWNGYSNDEKAAVMSRLSQLAGQVLEDRIRVVDPMLLRQKLKQRGVEPLHPQDDTQCVMAVLRSAAGQLSMPAEFGLEFDSSVSELSPLKLRDQIDTAIYELSAAHFDRYIRP